MTTLTVHTFFSKLFPSLLIGLDIAAGLTYLYYGDFRRFIYWLAAATLTACVTF